MYLSRWPKQISHPRFQNVKGQLCTRPNLICWSVNAWGVWRFGWHPSTVVHLFQFGPSFLTVETARVEWFLQSHSGQTRRSCDQHITTFKKEREREIGQHPLLRHFWSQHVLCHTWASWKETRGDETAPKSQALVFSWSIVTFLGWLIGRNRVNLLLEQTSPLKHQ